MAEASGSNGSLADFVWKNAEDLWGAFRHTDFGKIILPFTLLRRLECVLDVTRDAVVAAAIAPENDGLDLQVVLPQITRHPFFNTSRYTLATLGAGKTRQNLEDYVAQFSANARVIFEQFDFSNTLVRLDKAGVLYKICQNFAAIDLHPATVPDREMSDLYEHLIRRFGAAVNEGAEDFMTPRDVVRLATTLVLAPDDALFAAQPGLIRTLYDESCGTGGYLTDAMDHVADYAGRYDVPPTLVPYGQELEPETHAVCLTSMLLRTLPGDPGRDLSQNIKLGNTLSDDQFAGERFNYCLANPPFGKNWAGDAAAVEAEYKGKGYAGRFGPGLPRVSDGSMLFLLHMASKLERVEKGGGRGAIVLSGSPLFNGGAGSGESEIRRWLLEQDLVEAIVALPEQIFFRTGIGTYLWILSNKKPQERRGRVQLINATGLWTSIKNEGNKRREISAEQIRAIAVIYGAAQSGELSRMKRYEEFGYRRIRVLRPLRMHLEVSAETLAALKTSKAWQKLTEIERERLDAALAAHIGRHPYAWAKEFAEAPEKSWPKGKVRLTKTHIKALQDALGVRSAEDDPVLGDDGAPVADADLTDYENVPLGTAIQDYFAREVLPHVADAWIDADYRDEKDGETGRVGYEINFNRYFYEYEPPRKLEAIDADLREVESEIAVLLAEVAQ